MSLMGERSKRACLSCYCLGFPSHQPQCICADLLHQSCTGSVLPVHSRLCHFVVQSPLLSQPAMGSRKQKCGWGHVTLREPRANMSTMGLHCRFAWAAQCCIVTSWVPPVTLWVPPALLQLPPYCSVSPPVFSPGSCPVSSASQQLSEPGYPTSLSCRTVPLRWPRASSSCCPLDHRMS